MLHRRALSLHCFIVTALIPDLSDSNSIWFCIYLFPCLFDFEHVWFWNDLISKPTWFWIWLLNLFDSKPISDSEPVWYQTDMMRNLSDIEPEACLWPTPLCCPSVPLSLSILRLLPTPPRAPYVKISEETAKLGIRNLSPHLRNSAILRTTKSIAELRTKKSCGTAIADLQNLTSAIPQLSAVSCQFRYFLVPFLQPRMV
jgi:hypothetical protein